MQMSAALVPFPVGPLFEPDPLTQAVPGKPVDLRQLRDTLGRGRRERAPPFLSRLCPPSCLPAFSSAMVASILDVLVLLDEVNRRFGVKIALFVCNEAQNFNSTL